MKKIIILIVLLIFVSCDKTEYPTTDRGYKTDVSISTANYSSYDYNVTTSLENIDGDFIRAKILIKTNPTMSANDLSIETGNAMKDVLLSKKDIQYWVENTSEFNTLVISRMNSEKIKLTKAETTVILGNNWWTGLMLLLVSLILMLILLAIRAIKYFVTR